MASSQDGRGAALMRALARVQVRPRERKRWLVSPPSFDLRPDHAGRKCPGCEIPVQGLRLFCNLLGGRCRRLISPQGPRGQGRSTVPLQMLRTGRELVGKRLGGNTQGAPESGTHHRRPRQQREQDGLQPGTCASTANRRRARIRWHWRGAVRAGVGRSHGVHYRCREVRLFLIRRPAIATSFEVFMGAKSNAPTLLDTSAMKLSLRFAFLALARLGQSLQSLQESLRERVPQPAPVLVPIPIRAERRTRGPVGRHPYRRS